MIITKDNRPSVNGKAWTMDPLLCSELKRCCMLLEMGDLIGGMQIFFDKHSSTNEAAIHSYNSSFKAAFKSAFKMQTEDL